MTCDEFEDLVIETQKEYYLFCNKRPCYSNRCTIKKFYDDNNYSDVECETVFAAYKFGVFDPDKIKEIELYHVKKTARILYLSEVIGFIIIISIKFIIYRIFSCCFKLVIRVVNCLTLLNGCPLLFVPQISFFPLSRLKPLK